KIHYSIYFLENQRFASRTYNVLLTTIPETLMLTATSRGCRHRSRPAGTMGAAPACFIFGCWHFLRSPGRLFFIDLFTAGRGFSPCLVLTPSPSAVFPKRWSACC